MRAVAAARPGDPPTRQEVLAALRLPDFGPAFNRTEVAWLIDGARARGRGRLARPQDPKVSALSTGELLRALEREGTVIGARGFAARHLGRRTGLMAAAYYYALPERVSTSDPDEEAFRSAWSLLERALDGAASSVYGTPARRVMVELSTDQALALVARLTAGAEGDRR